MLDQNAMIRRYCQSRWMARRSALALFWVFHSTMLHVFSVRSFFVGSMRRRVISYWRGMNLMERLKQNKQTVTLFYDLMFNQCSSHSLSPRRAPKMEPRSKKVLRLSCRGVASARPGRRPHLRWKPPTSVGGAPPFKAARDGLPHNLRLQPRRIYLLGNPAPPHRSVGPN